MAAMHTLLSLLAWVAPAAAEDPEFLLADLAVRLDLDKSRWHMTRWSTFDFEAKGEKDPILLFAWATPVQTPVSAARAGDPGQPTDGWGALYVNQVVNKLQGSDPKVLRTAIEDLKGKPWAFVDVAFQTPAVGAIALRGATTELEGQNFHFMIVAPARLANVAERERDKIARKLELQKPVPAPEYGGKVQNEQMSTKLPPGWRALLEGELDAVGQRILQFGIDDVTGCWVAIRPRPGLDPDVMVTCPRPMHLGVIDSHSLAGEDVAVRERLFGGKIPAGHELALSDRMGFLYAPRDGLSFAVIPDGDRVSVTWATGEGPLDDQVQAALAPASFAAPHVPSTNDWVRYYLSYQWTSPLVVCPALCLVGGILLVVGVGVAVGRRGRRSAEEDED